MNCTTLTGASAGLDSAARGSVSPEEWRDFFVMLGGGAAALTGFVVVAMSLHLDVISRDQPLRHRAHSILTGLAAVFMRSGLVLIGGQSAQVVAAELFGVCAIAVSFSIVSFAQVMRAHKPVPHSSVYRTIFGTNLYVVEMLGAVVLFAGSTYGLWVAAVAIVRTFT